MSHPEPREEPLLWSMRATALVVVGGMALFLPLEIDRARHAASAWRLVPYAGILLLTALLVVSSWTATGRRHVAGIALAWVAGVAACQLAYLRIEPAFEPLVASGLASLLVGTTVLGSWPIQRTAVVSAAVVLVFCGVALPTDRTPGGVPLAFSLAGLLLGVGIALTCAFTLGRLRAALARRHHELTQLSSRLMAVHEDERGVLSRELHDGVGQSLTAVLAYLWLVERLVPQDAVELRARVVETRRLASQTLAQIRELSQRLRPSVLDDYGLVPSLEAHVQAFGDRVHLATTFRAEALPERLAPEIETAVYRITQEALDNVARHARAQRVRVSLDVDGPELRLEVADDGVGLVGGNGTEGIGLLGVRERVRALGGRFALVSDHGARLEVRLPLRPATPDWSDALQAGDESH